MYREGNLRFKIDRASLIVGRKFTVFALFYFVFEGSFQVQDPRGGLYLEGLIFEILRYTRVRGGKYLQGKYKGVPGRVKFIFILARKGIRAFHYSKEPVSATVGEYVRPRQFSTDLN